MRGTLGGGGEAGVGRNIKHVSAGQPRVAGGLGMGVEGGRGVVGKGGGCKLTNLNLTSQFCRAQKHLLSGNILEPVPRDATKGKKDSTEDLYFSV